MTYLIFCEHLDTLLAEKIYLDLCNFLIIKNCNFFQSKLFVRAYFFNDLASSISKISHKWFMQLLVILMK